MMRLYTYRYWHRFYREYVTLDCPAETREAALVSARRFIDRANRRLKRCGVPMRLPIPSHVNFLKEEP